MSAMLLQVDGLGARYGRAEALRDMSFDVARKRIYVTGSDTASVFEQLDADHYKHIAEVPTAFRAKSSIFVPQLKRLYVADSGKGKPDAKLALQIFEVQ